jgi:serine/threonine protein kinase
MTDPDRTQAVTDSDRAHDDRTENLSTDPPRTLAPGDDATLMPPPADPPTVALGETAEPAGTLVLPGESQAPVVGPATLPPPTVAPPRFDFSAMGETLAPPPGPVPAGETTELDPLRTGPVPAESSGTLLDAHLLATPSEQITASAPPVIPRVTNPGRPAPGGTDVPSTVARPAALKTARMPTVTMPKVEGYDVLSELGRGGMGVVYKARQEGLNRIVALKMVLSAGRASVEELARFTAEAKAVAELHHPNIVQVYDIGTYSGLPYFSLEFCPGGTLGERTANKPQPPRLAARIVRDLAGAVHHAHQRLILHRDLKPANVLLAPADSPGTGATVIFRKAKPDERTTPMAKGSRPAVPAVPRSSSGRAEIDLEHCTPKITDFGLAKRLEGDAGQTRDGSVMGTPSYMAPEQAQGKVRELGPPADVYALGAILYDLLTGNPPFRGETVMDTLHQVIHREPVAPRGLHSKIPPDLDTICLKCLEKDPAKRYASADALAEDLRRFLDGEPILARPTPWWEKTIKWARRRPAAAGLAAVCALAAVALAAGGYELARREAATAATEAALKDTALGEKEKAETQRQRAEQLKGLAEEHFRKACAAVDQLLARVGHERLAHEPRMEQIRQELLQKAAGFYEGFLRERGDDPSVKWQTARTQKNLGDIEEMLGKIDLAEERYRAALTLLTELHDADPENRDFTRDLAAARHNFGLLLAESSRTVEAEKSLRLARDLRLGLVAQSSSNDDRDDLAASNHALGLQLERRGDYADAETAFKAALEEQKKVADDVPSGDRRVKALRELARTENSLGRVAEAANRDKDAEKFYEDARGVLTKLAAEVPKLPEVRQELGQTYNNLGRLHRDTNPAAAEKNYEEAVRVAEKLADDFPATPAYRQDLAAALNNLGILQLAVNRGTDAENSFSRALQLKERLAAEIHWVTDYRRDYGAGLNNRGIQLRTQNRADDADKAFIRAVKVLGDLVEEHGNVPDYQRELARTLVNRALVRQSAGRPDEAESLLKKALDWQQKLVARRDSLPEYRSELNRTHVALGALYQVRGQTAAPRDPAKGRENLERAEAEYRAALAGFKELAQRFPDEPDFRYHQALAGSALAGVLAARGQSAEAKSQWGAATDLLARLADEHANVPGYRIDLGRALNDRALHNAMTGSLKEAGEQWARAGAALAEVVKLFPKEVAARQELAKVENNRAVLALKANRLDESTAAYRRAVAALEGLPPALQPGPEYRYDLMTRHRALAEQLMAAGAPSQEVETEWQGVVNACRALVKEAPDNPQYERELGIAAHQLARFLLVQNRPEKSRTLLDEAVAAQQAALKLAPTSNKALLAGHLELLKEVLLFQLGDHAAAAAAVGELVSVKPGAGADRHEAAAVALAHCSELAAADAKLSESQRRETARGYADRAMAELQAAVKDGFKDAAKLKKKPFDALRQREDFKELAKKLEG